jgi:glycosyltransferase involved in cell wall biosynthesis
MSPSQPVDEQPLVTIGVPVYNEERFLEGALESLLSQDYENIRILILDNASADRTGEIASRVARANERITYGRLCARTASVVASARDPDTREPS